MVPNYGYGLDEGTAVIVGLGVRVLVRVGVLVDVNVGVLKYVFLGNTGNVLVLVGPEAGNTCRSMIEISSISPVISGGKETN